LTTIKKIKKAITVQGKVKVKDNCITRTKLLISKLSKKKQTIFNKKALLLPLLCLPNKD